MGHAVSYAGRSVQQDTQAVDQGTSRTPSRSRDGQGSPKAAETPQGNGISLQHMAVAESKCETHDYNDPKKRCVQFEGVSAGQPGAGELHGDYYDPFKATALLLAGAGAAAAVYNGHGYLYPSSAPRDKATTSLLAALAAVYMGHNHHNPRNKAVAESDDISAGKPGTKDGESDDQRPSSDPTHGPSRNATPSMP